MLQQGEKNATRQSFLSFPLSDLGDSDGARLGKSLEPSEGEALGFADSTDEGAILGASEGKDVVGAGVADVVESQVRKRNTTCSVESFIVDNRMEVEYE